MNSIDYLLKPVEDRHLARALDRIERLQAAGQVQPSFADLASQLASLLHRSYPERIASRVGERIQFLELARITHFFARDKLTYASGGEKNHVVNYTIADLEQKLDPKQFCRIHRATLLNLAWVAELDTWFDGRLLARLKDEKRTELAGLARSRAGVEEAFGRLSQHRTLLPRLQRAVEPAAGVRPC